MRAAIYDKLLGGRNSDKDASMARCIAYSDREVPQDILQNINGTLHLFVCLFLVIWVKGSNYNWKTRINK